MVRRSNKLWSSLCTIQAGNIYSKYRIFPIVAFMPCILRLRICKLYERVTVCHTIICDFVLVSNWSMIDDPPASIWFPAKLRQFIWTVWWPSSTRHSKDRSSRRPYNFEMFFRCLTQVHGEPEEDVSHGLIQSLWLHAYFCRNIPNYRFGDKCSSMNPQAHQNALSPAHSLRYSFASGGTSHTFRLYFKRLSERFRLLVREDGHRIDNTQNLCSPMDPICACAQSYTSLLELMAKYYRPFPTYASLVVQSRPHEVPGALEEPGFAPWRQTLWGGPLCTNKKFSPFLRGEV